MTSFARGEVRWVVQPLLDAGLAGEEVTDLVFRLAFQAVVSGGAGLEHLVADQPTAVRAAWHQTLGRMLLTDPAVG